MQQAVHLLSPLPADAGDARIWFKDELMGEKSIES